MTLLLHAQGSTSVGFSWAMLPTLVVSIATALGAARLLELFVTRNSRRGSDQKVEIDAASVISGELRQWAAEANSRARAAEERAQQIEQRLQARIDEVMSKLQLTEDALDRLQDKIMACQGGPVCPVRTGDDLRVPIVPHRP